jgi:diadenosine tetraphosphatase ApaH/serine/threonine PP2A family protein phosphatase
MTGRLTPDTGQSKHDNCRCNGSSKAVSEHSKQIIGFRETASAAVVTLMGNHEDWLLRTHRDFTRHSWVLGMEAFETIRSYSPKAERSLRRELDRTGPSLITGRVRIPYGLFFEQVPASHIHFLENLKLFCRTPDAVCVSGGIDPKKGAVEEQDRETLLWGCEDFPAGYDGGDAIVYGHSNNHVINEAGWPEPTEMNHTIGIDTISFGVLTAVRLPDRRPCQLWTAFSSLLLN